MLYFRYLKTSPTTYVIQNRNGRVVREGEGLAFWYFAPSSSIVQVPTSSQAAPFAFMEVTADFQDATIQGELTYRVVDAKKLSAMLDHTVDGRGRYNSDDPSKVTERLVHAMQILTRAFTQRHTLGQLLINSRGLLAEVLAGVRESETVAMLGLEVLDLSILSISATPEMAKALQAEARETLLRQADEAVYARRNAAVEQERAIKENELQTEIAVESKRRQVRETRMQADVAVEQQRAELVDRRVANERKEAEARGEALRLTLEPLKDVDWRTLMAAGGGGLDPRTMISMAFRDLADNAEKIGQINITPDLLREVIDGAPAGGAEPAKPSPRKRG